MADVTITAANVVPQANAQLASGTAGVAITAGQQVAIDNSSASPTVKLCDVNSASAWQRVPAGAAVNNAAVGQPVVYQTGGDLAIGGTLVSGAAYFASGTPGGIRPQADNTTGDYPAIIGMAISTSVLRVAIVAPGIQI